MKKYNAFRVCPLPVDTINRTLGTYLDPGDLWVSKAAHRHIALDHPEDYQAIIANIHQIVSDPTYLGVNTKHRDNFYMVRRIDLNEPKAGLIAVGFDLTEFGTYNLRSGYRIKQSDIDARREKRLLLIARK